MARRGLMSTEEDMKESASAGGRLRRREKIWGKVRHEVQTVVQEKNHRSLKKEHKISLQAVIISVCWGGRASEETMSLRARQPRR